MRRQRCFWISSDVLASGWKGRRRCHSPIGVRKIVFSRSFLFLFFYAHREFIPMNSYPLPLMSLTHSYAPPFYHDHTGFKTRKRKSIVEGYTITSCIQNQKKSFYRYSSFSMEQTSQSGNARLSARSGIISARTISPSNSLRLTESSSKYLGGTDNSSTRRPPCTTAG